MNRQPANDEAPPARLPVVGIYDCLYCGSRFSAKVNLKQHYHKRHGASIPDFRGNQRATAKRRKRLEETIQRITVKTAIMPLAATQLAILIITLLLSSSS